MPLFTIFVPTYNRADVLLRTLDSIAAQDERDYQILVVDDGSTDDTRQQVEAWQARSGIPVDYVYQPNGGKTAAHNTMLEHARGELTVLLNSDDLLTAGALGLIRRTWEEAREQPGCAGIEGLSADLDSGRLLGTAYPRDGMLGNWLEMRQRHGVRGDKLNVIRTAVLREFPFPRFPGEKHVPESTVWSRIAHRYTFWHVNQVLQRKEYRADGITRAWSDKKSRNPQGYRQFYLEMFNDHRAYYRLGRRLSAAKRYAYLSFVCGLPLRRQWAEARDKLVYLAALPAGWLKYRWGRDND